jgi:hypothetical protein
MGRKERGRHTDTEKKKIFLKKIKNKNKIKKAQGEKRCDARVAQVWFRSGENKSCRLA